jgi:hypothetical protein
MKTTVVNMKKAPYDVFIGRPSKWGNPFRIGPDGTREEVIEKYQRYITLRRPDLLAAIHTELKGLVLGCYCKPLPCHGDVLAAIANEE